MEGRFGKLVVLDLDETLIHSTQTGVEGVAHHDEAFGYRIYHRPYVREFIDALLARFEVGIWTASTAAYAARIVPELVDPRRLSFLWSRSECAVVSVPSTGRFDLAKDITQLERRGHDPADVLFVDDMPERLTASPDNVVPMLPFVGDPEDRTLTRLLPYLLALGPLPDVRVVDKRAWEVPLDEYARRRLRRLRAMG